MNGIKPKILTLISITLCIKMSRPSITRLQEVFAWKDLDFQFPEKDLRNTAIETEQFIPGNGVITGIEVYMDRMFISVPRIKLGIPSTLNYIEYKKAIEDNVTAPVLIPYPSFEDNLQAQQTSVPSLLVSVYHTTADPCGRLWAIDSGINAVDNNNEIRKQIPPTIHVFDLKTDQLLFSYSLKPKTDYNDDDSLFSNIVVDVTSGNCDDAFVYLPDVGSPAVVVYNLKSNETHRLTHNYFHFDPISGDFYTKTGKHYQWQYGIFGMALSPIDKDNYRTVYFHPLASTMEFTVSTKTLQNSTQSEKYLDAFRILGDRGPNSQSTISVLDEETGNIFYTQIVKNSVVCWNSYKGEDYLPNSLGVIASDDELMAYPYDVDVDNEGFIWILTDKFSEMMYSSLDRNTINMRVYRVAVREAIKGTVCD